jgi:hypothetical protein
MINTTTKVDVDIDDVSEIRISPVSDGFYGVKMRWITVETSHGEFYCLHLKSQDAQKLEIRELPDDEEDDWLTPKVYRDKDIGELAEDQHPDK